MEVWPENGEEYSDCYGQDNWQEGRLPFQSYTVNWQCSHSDTSEADGTVQQFTLQSDLQGKEKHQRDRVEEKFSRAISIGQRLMSPQVQMINHEKLRDKNIKTPQTRRRLLQKHRDSERVRHQALNQVMSEICNKIPQYIDHPKETKVQMMRRIVKYIAYLEYTICDLCAQLGVTVEHRDSFLTTRVIKKIKCRGRKKSISRSNITDCEAMLDLFLPEFDCALSRPSSIKKSHKGPSGRITPTYCVSPSRRITTDPVIPSPCCCYEIPMCSVASPTKSSTTSHNVWIPSFMLSEPCHSGFTSCDGDQIWTTTDEKSIHINVYKNWTPSEQ